MNPIDLIHSIEAELASSQGQQTNSSSLLSALLSLYKKQQRQQERLIKLSDANEAKLTQTNQTLDALTKNLSRFVPQTVVKALMQDGQDDVVRLKRQEITVFFSDIVSFTSLTERLEPEQLATIMSDYFTEMSSICDKWGGTLDQFIGDAILIFFGAPETTGTTNDANQAIGMALEMNEALAQLRQRWAQQGLNLEFQVRMGLSTGFSHVGNFGASDRLHYTALGNVVNEAARIQELGKAGQILLSQDTYAHIQERFDCTEYDKLTLKGYSHELVLYELSLQQKDWQSQLINHQQTGFHMHLDPSSIKDKDEAIAHLQKALQKIMAPQEIIDK